MKCVVDTLASSTRLNAKLYSIDLLYQQRATKQCFIYVHSVLYLCAFDRPRRGLCFKRDMTLSVNTKRTRNT